MHNVAQILVVEDDLDGQEFIDMVLQHMDIDHTLANDAYEAEQFMATGDFDAIIIDLALPGKDGWQLLKTIRMDDRYAHVPCIAITAYHTSKTRQDALEAGFTAYIPKPMNAMQLVEQLEQAF